MVAGGFEPLESYGLVGNLETCALVGETGGIHWAPLPDLASPSVFTALLDTEKGGHFTVQPVGEFESTQCYRPSTNVLETRFETDRGSATVTDFMPVLSVDPEAPFAEPWLFRKVVCDDGSVDLDVTFEPRFDYARARTVLEPIDEGVLARGNGEHVSLTAPTGLDVDRDSAAGIDRLEAGDERWYTVQYGMRKRPTSIDPDALLERTETFWRNWVHDCDDPASCRFGAYHDEIVRSELALKLLMYHRTGAIAAAPTTSLPETIGGSRNWDYRFSWLRDAAYTVRALLKVGHAREAEDYMDWFLDVILSETESLQPFQPLYGLHGERELEEEVLDHLSGYRDSDPVRIGNAATGQLQLDIYGELVVTLYEMAEYGRPIHDATWEAIRDIVEFVRVLWNRRDQGLWEIRSDPKHFVHSKVLCWAAMDRAIELAGRRRDHDAPVDRWRDVRQEIRGAVLERGYDESRGTFLRSFEDDRALDAATLRIPLVGFLPFDDPRVQGTVDAVMDRLTTEEGFVYRYRGEDGLAGEEGAFLLTTLWLVDCLALSGRVDEAERIFENVLAEASPHGLLAEEIDPESGELRGNYPQAFSHLGVINSAAHLEAARGDADAAEPPLDDLDPADGAVVD